jgi:putative hemolysin
MAARLRAKRPCSPLLAESDANTRWDRLLGLVLLWCLASATIGCASTAMSDSPHRQESTPQIANPASAHCVKQGGTSSIRKRGDGAEYGLCVFENNRQCEEWAMFRGDCPIGGIIITGYVTPAAQYCATAGGTYRTTANSNTDQEKGTCTDRNGRTCDARLYFAGGCDQRR